MYGNFVAIDGVIKNQLDTSLFTQGWRKFLLDLFGIFYIMCLWYLFIY
jgi:hypothetical protein